MLDQIFMKIWDMTCSASIVILFVLCLRILLRRAPKRYSFILWAAVLYRLLCPVIPEVSFGVFPQLDSISEQYTLSDDPITLGGASLAAYRAMGDALNGGLGIQHVRTTGQTADGMAQYVSAGWWEIWILLGQYVWLTGLVFLLAKTGYTFFRFRRRLRGATRLDDQVYLSDQIDTAFVYGWICPRIYVPAVFSEEMRKYAILHEQIHIAGRDPVWKILAYLARCIHWMNPLVWLAFRLSEQDMEMSCDEAVLSRLPREKHADYAESLLHMVSAHSISIPIPPAYGEGNIKGRIKNMTHWKTPKKWMLLASMLVCVLLLAACSVDAKPETPAVEPEESNDATQLVEEEKTPSAPITDADSYAEQQAQIENDICDAKEDFMELRARIECRDPACDDVSHPHEVRARIMITHHSSHHEDDHCSSDHH